MLSMLTTAQNLFDYRELMATPAWKPIALRYFNAAGAYPVDKRCPDKRCPTPFYQERPGSRDVAPTDCDSPLPGLACQGCALRRSGGLSHRRRCFQGRLSRVFLDTNVLASAMATRGLCAELFEGVLAEHDLLSSQAVLAELARILAARFHMHAELVEASIELIEDSAELIPQTMALTTPRPDPDDVAILAAARAGEAACFVTGDTALLEPGEVDTMPVLSPRQYWERFHLGR